jgi:Leishmanolysin
MRRADVLFLSLACATSGCGNDGAEPGPGTGTPATITPTGGTDLSGFFGNYLVDVPEVTVADAGGDPVSGVQVVFQAEGGGQLTGTPVETDDQGRASPTSWRLGSAGAQTVTATVTGLTPAVFTATAVPPSASTFSIEVRYLAGTVLSTAQRAAFDSAAARWSQIILRGGSPYLIYEHVEGCGDLRGETVEGVVIFAALRMRDGPGGVVAASGPCILRDEGYLPAQGYMELDMDDLAILEEHNLLGSVVLHEMAHVLGFGTIWNFNPRSGSSSNAFLLGSKTDDPTFSGPAARAAFYGALGSAGYSGTPVPVEATGGSGTALSHWRESSFDTELMTGWLDAGTNPLSAVTVAQFRDLGYTVNDALADSYSLPALLRTPAAPALELVEAVLPMPIVVINRSGRKVGTSPRSFH